ncbi:hypothetical protein Tco_1456832 [Tanacetum coccineum]
MTSSYCTPIPPKYGIMLPKSNQAIFDAPSGYVGLYTNSFTLSNLMLPLTKFFYEVLQHFQIHISRLNPVGCAKLTTFVVMCKAYGCEPSIELFWGFFNLCRGGKWLNFAKRPEKHIPHLFSQGHYSWDSKSYKDKLPPNIEKNHMFQRLGKYPTSVRVFPDPILFLAGLQPSNFIYAKNEEDLSFLPKEPSPGLGTGSPSVSVNTKPPSVDVEPSLKLTEDTADFGGSPKPEVFVVHPGSVAARTKDRKCKTRGGSSRLHVKRKLAPRSSSSRATRAKASSSKDDTLFLMVFDDDEGFPDVFELKDANVCHLKISAITPPTWKNHLDNHIDVELLDLHDCCYARQAFLDNVMNRRSRELLQVIEKNKGECDVMKEIERAREEECEELRSKCKASKTAFEKNPIVVSLSALESKVASLEAEKARLEAVEASLKKEVDDVKRDRMEVILKVVPYAALKLVHSDELGRLVSKLVSSAVLYRRCAAFE